MRNFLQLLSFVAFLFFFSSLKAQSYTPFPDSNATWQAYTWDLSNSNGPPVSPPTTKDIYTFGKDTIVNGLTYRKLYDVGTFIGGLRQDIANKKVYYLSIYHSAHTGKDTLVDTLLYNFNLKVGDTLPQSYLYDSAKSGIITITSIDSQLVGSTYYRRFNTNSTVLLNNGGIAYALLEGIGNIFGLFFNAPVGSESMAISCFNQNALYSDFGGSYYCGSIPAGNMPPVQSLVNLQIFPNPATDVVTIQLNNSSGGNLELLDVQGSKVKQQSFSGSTTSVSLSGLNNGLYMLHIISGESNNYTKLIKQ